MAAMAHTMYDIFQTKLVCGPAAKYYNQPGAIITSIPLYLLLSVPTRMYHDPVLSRILGPDNKKKVRYGWIDTAVYELQLQILAALHHPSFGEDSPSCITLDILPGAPTDW
jgi:hypothetical protein